LDKWVDLDEFIKLLPQGECPHEHTSTNVGFHFTAGEVWDNLTEVCDDIGRMQIVREKYFSMGALNQKSLEVIERID
jgi:hypothetical protein